MVHSVLLGFSFNINIFLTLACAASLVFMLGRLSVRHSSPEAAD
jgi:hypothetical protein